MIETQLAADVGRPIDGNGFPPRGGDSQLVQLGNPQAGQQLPVLSWDGRRVDGPSPDPLLERGLVDRQKGVQRTGQSMRAAGVSDDLGVRAHSLSLAFLSDNVNRTSSVSVATAVDMTPGERLRSKREERGISAAELASRVGRSESAVRNQENGTNGIPPGLAKRYAQALGTTASWILYGEEGNSTLAAPEMAALPLLGPIRAGAWLSIDDTIQQEPETRAAARDRRYPHAEQWLREVQGDSMNARNIFPGDLVHIVDLAGAGVNLNTGMIVEVIRERDGGSLREITLKEVEVTPDGLTLWPRSTNPRWSAPVRLDDDSGRDTEVRVTGLLLAKITLF